MEIMTNQDEIVLLTTASSEVEAGMWNQELQAAGIRTLIRPGGPGAGAWASAATFEHYIYVRADQLGKAREVLGAALSDDPPLPRARHVAPIVNPARIRHSGK